MSKKWLCNVFFFCDCWVYLIEVLSMQVWNVAVKSLHEKTTSVCYVCSMDACLPIIFLYWTVLTQVCFTVEQGIYRERHCFRKMSVVLKLWALNFFFCDIITWKFFQKYGKMLFKPFLTYLLNIDLILSIILILL